MNNIDILWVLVSAFLVFLMQFGFALIETGTVRSKNTINVAMKNLIDTTFGIIFFWIIGFGIMFGTDLFGLFGTDGFLIDGNNPQQNGFFFFQSMFAATAITIVSGAVAERMKFNGYIVVSIIVTSLIYPVFGHWAWSDGGWLKELGFTDFAGSTVVHSIGAWIGLAGAFVLGPRLGKFSKNGIKYFAPSNHNFIVFGVFILIFGWFGFNGGSLLEFNENVTKILINTTLAAVFGGLGAWLISLVAKERVSVEIFSFGIIAGLVGITAGCDQFTTHISAFVGFIAAFVMYYFDMLILKKFKLDDPLSVIAIHGFAGIWGTLAVGFFGALPDTLSRIEFIGVQMLGIFSAFVFASFFGLLMFYLLARSDLLRVRKKHEVLGLNISEHNAKLPWVETIESIIKIMKTGNIDNKIYEERGTEVGLVTKFFNYLLGIVKIKQNKMVQLLDNAGQGFLTFDNQLNIESEYSKECEKMFQTNLEGINIVELLYQNKSDEDKKTFYNMLYNIFDSNFPKVRKKALARLLPREFTFKNKSIKVQYKMVSKEKIMLILTDVTEKKELESKVEEERKLLQMVVSVAKDISEFKGMIKEYDEFDSSKQKFINNSNLIVSATEYYRAIHTFKGNFAQKDMINVVSHLHKYESKLSEFLKDPNRTQEEFVSLISKSDLKAWLNDDILILQDVLGENILKEDDILFIKKAKLQELEDKVQELIVNKRQNRTTTYENILEDIAKMNLKTLFELLSPYQDTVSKLAHKLSKNIYPLQIVGAEDINVNENIHPFIKSLVHIFRNSVDHGIELDEERENLQKDPKGSIHCITNKGDTNLTLDIVDDGRGIDVAKIKQKILNKGLMAKSQLEAMREQEILQYIFLDELSTAESVSEISGRGIGLGAVKEEVEKLGGSIDIISTIDKGTTFRFIIPLRDIT